MSPVSNLYPEYHDPVPACCHDCIYIDYDHSEFSDSVRWYCEIGVRLPTKKKTCARQSKPLPASKETT